VQEKQRQEDKQQQDQALSSLTSLQLAAATQGMPALPQLLSGCAALSPPPPPPLQNGYGAYMPPPQQQHQQQQQQQQSLASLATTAKLLAYMNSENRGMSYGNQFPGARPGLRWRSPAAHSQCAWQLGMCPGLQLGW
jgi:type IV secretory pathway VirB10-like protein